MPGPYPSIRKNYWSKKKKKDQKPIYYIFCSWKHSTVMAERFFQENTISDKVSHWIKQHQFQMTAFTES